MVRKNQLERTDFDDQLLNYKKWSIHYTQGYYAPAHTQVVSGLYKIKTLLAPGYNIGLDYTFNRERRISYFTGIGLDHIPYFMGSWNIPSSELPQSASWATGRNTWEDYNSTSLLTIPIGVDYKFSKNGNTVSNFYLDLKAAIHFHIMLPDDIGWYWGDPTQFAFGEIEFKTKKINWLSPTINISCAANWMSPVGIVSLQLVLQKGIVPYYRGAYVFYNFNHAPNTYAYYNVRADYIGLDLAFTPKKIHPKY